MTTSEIKKPRFEPGAPLGFEPGPLGQKAIALPLAPPPRPVVDKLTSYFQNHLGIWPKYFILLNSVEYKWTISSSVVKQTLLLNFETIAGT